MTQAGGSCSLTQTTTTRGPSLACTSAGVAGQLSDTSGAQPPVAASPHQLTIPVPKSAALSLAEMAAVTVRVIGFVASFVPPGFGPGANGFELPTVIAATTHTLRFAP